MWNMKHIHGLFTSVAGKNHNIFMIFQAFLEINLF